MQRRKNILIVGTLFIFLIVACQNQADNTLTPTPTVLAVDGTLARFATSTPNAPGNGNEEKTPTLAPSPTPTPQVHVVALDETMITIAFNYGISLETLQNANPEANPYALIVGDELLIPYQEPQEEGEEATPPPEAVELSEANCYPEASGGAWCLWTATNPTESGTENILIDIELGSDANPFSITQIVPAPINISFAGQRVPMGVFFDAETLKENGLTAPFQVHLTLLQALPLNNTASRYVPITLSDGEIVVSADQSSAEIRGTIALREGTTQEASNIWVVAAAYNAEGTLVGFRRWEQQTTLSDGAMLPLEMQVFALGNQDIANVDILLEAKP